jgi:hypothetical protein
MGCQRLIVKLKTSKNDLSINPGTSQFINAITWSVNSATGGEESRCAQYLDYPLLDIDIACPGDKKKS